MFFANKKSAHSYEVGVENDNARMTKIVTKFQDFIFTCKIGNRAAAKNTKSVRCGLVLTPKTGKSLCYKTRLPPSVDAYLNFCNIGIGAMEICVNINLAVDS